jgi:hypothetical protein
VNLDQPVLVETSRGVTRRWWCWPPPRGTVFTVTDSIWSADYRTQDIYGWRLSLLEHIIDCGGYQLCIIPEVL